MSAHFQNTAALFEALSRLVGKARPAAPVPLTTQAPGDLVFLPGPRRRKAGPRERDEVYLVLDPAGHEPPTTGRVLVSFTDFVWGCSLTEVRVAAADLATFQVIPLAGRRRYPAPEPDPARPPWGYHPPAWGAPDPTL